MQETCNIQRYNRKILVAIFTTFLLLIIHNSYINATVRISAPDKVNVGDTIVVTLDFGTYVGAYDLLEITYNSRILKNASTIPLIERYWFDNTEESKGIRYKTYVFKALKNGTLSIGANIKGLVGADSKMENIGDMYVYKTIIVGNGIEAGDINQDGFINSTDAALVLDLFKNGGATQTDYLRGDVDNNGILDSTDAAMILDIYKNN